MRSTQKKLIEGITKSLKSSRREIETLHPLYDGDELAINETHFHSDVDNQRKTIAIEVENLLRNIESEATRALQNIFNDVNRIRGLYSRWNTLSPVSRIPPEILCEIFLQLKALDRVEDHLDVDGPQVYHSPLGTPWQVVSHVCQTWRSVALNCAALWSRISLDWGAEHISEFASRSKEANLEIYNASDPKKDHILARLFPGIEVLNVYTGRDWNFCDSADLSAPLLKDLTFIGNCLIRNKNLSLARLLCFGAAPQLQKLHLSNHAVDWPDTFRHPNLKYLHINASNYPPTSNGTCARLLAALAAMPHLETLKLLGCLPSDLESLNPFRHRHFTVALPRLQSIYLRERRLPCANLLPFLSISPKCAVWLGGVADHSDEFVRITHCLIRLNEHFSSYCMVADHESQLVLRVIPISDSYPDPGWEPKHNFGNRPELIIDDAINLHELLITVTQQMLQL